MIPSTFLSKNLFCKLYFITLKDRRPRVDVKFFTTSASFRVMNSIIRDTQWLKVEENFSYFFSTLPSLIFPFVFSNVYGLMDLCFQIVKFTFLFEVQFVHLCTVRPFMLLLYPLGWLLSVFESFLAFCHNIGPKGLYCKENICDTEPTFWFCNSFFLYFKLLFSPGAVRQHEDPFYVTVG